jgi:tRNA(Ile)-lysidine synthase
MLFEIVRTFFEQAGMAGSRGVVAVSGGPDSMALAHVLARLRREGFLADLVVGHVNHKLRGAESDDDEAFVAGWCDQWRFPRLPGSPPPRWSCVAGGRVSML